MMLFIFCGSPASGKTSLSKKISEEQKATRYSFDEMHCFQHKELVSPIIHSLLMGENVVVDALFTRIIQRKMILEATKNINCEKILIFMDTPLEECIRRNTQRPNPLPEFMIRDIYNSIEIPTLDEGWDDIWYFK